MTSMSEQGQQGGAMTTEIVQQGSGIGVVGGEHNEPVGADPGHDRQPAVGFQHGGLEAAEPGGIGEGAGVAGEGGGERGRGFRIDRTATGRLDRQTVTAQENDRGHVGAVGEAPHRLSQTVQTTPSAGAEKR